MSWLILRILTGHPFVATKRLQDFGLNPYCPSFVTKRRRPHSEVRCDIEVVCPLFPGYLFIDQPFDVTSINTMRLKTRLMARDGAYLRITPAELERVRDAERQATSAWQPKIGDIVSAFAELVTNAGPQKFMRLSDLQAKKRVAA